MKKNGGGTSKIILIVCGAIFITLLIGLPRINMMQKIEDLGIHNFMMEDYFRRIVAVFLTALLFLFLNTMYGRIRVLGIHFDLSKWKGILLFNILLSIVFNIAFVAFAGPKSKAAGIAEGMAIWVFLINQIIIVVSVLIGTAYRFMEENYHMKITNEKLHTEAADARFANLKEQLNPHFMFNSFSTLQGLIDISPERAKKFLLNMSDLYRYVITSEDKITVELKEELKFVNFYLAMIQERFANAVNIKININKELLNKQVLPLSVQMLLENAVKHNRFDREHPLQINIATFREGISVSNNLRPRDQYNNHNHSMGLHNLNQRYRYLNKSDIHIQKNSDTFTVKLPFIYEYPDHRR